MVHAQAHGSRTGPFFTWARYRAAMPDQPARAVRWHAHLPAAVAQALRELAEAALVVDGSPPLNDEATLHLDRPGRHLLAGATPVLGYAQVDPTGAAQLVVAPVARRQGLGRRLVDALLEAVPDVAVWAFGDGPGARALAARYGYHPARTLLRMHRALTSAPDAGPAPAGITFRSYRPGVDAEAWVEVNAAAFASHPEQGRMSVADVAVREAADWFDPDGFILAERDGRIVGFHWTKSHPAHGSGPATTGEVYVLGVHPDAGGQGLGRALLDRGLAHLHTTGHTEVILYVEAEQARVVRMYQGSGFTVATRDVIYARGPSPAHDTSSTPSPTSPPDRDAGAGWT